MVKAYEKIKKKHPYYITTLRISKTRARNKKINTQ